MKVVRGGRAINALVFTGWHLRVSANAPDLLQPQILLDLGLKKIRLLTNNPRKIVGLEGYNLEITGRVPLNVDSGEHNKGYLDTKRSKLGHLL